MREPLVQGRQLPGFGDVEVLDLDAAAGAVRQVVQGCAGGGVPDGADDVPPAVEELGGDRVAEAAGRADDEGGGFGGFGHFVSSGSASQSHRADVCTARSPG